MEKKKPYSQIYYKEIGTQITSHWYKEIATQITSHWYKELNYIQGTNEFKKKK